MDFRGWVTLLCDWGEKYFKRALCARSLLHAWNIVGSWMNFITIRLRIKNYNIIFFIIRHQERTKKPQLFQLSGDLILTRICLFTDSDIFT